MPPDVEVPVPELTDILSERLKEDKDSDPDLNRIVLAPPGGVGVVNVPVIASTKPAAAISDNVTLPLPGRIAAVPEYTWDFGPRTAARHGSGTPYDGKTTPRQDPGKYLTHNYDVHGKKTITLTITWTGTFAIDDLVVPLDPQVFTTTATIDIREAVPELIAPEAVRTGLKGG